MKSGQMIGMVHGIQCYSCAPHIPHLCSHRWLSRYAAGGSGYLLSWDLFNAIISTQTDPPRNIIPIYEDASVGLWVQHVMQNLQVDVQFVSSSLFNEFGCQDGLHEVTSHPVTPKQMICLFHGKCRCVAEQGIAEIILNNE